MSMRKTIMLGGALAVPTDGSVVPRTLEKEQMQVELTTQQPGDWPEPVETSELDSRDRNLEFRSERERLEHRDERVTIEVTGLIVLILVVAAAAVWLLNCKVRMQWPFGP